VSITYSIGNYTFTVEDFLPKNLFDKITDVRVDRRNVVLAEAKERIRRKKLTKDGKLTILAADHPARMVTQVGDNPIAMGNRYELLGRILRVITDEEFDGVMGTPDIIEELLIVNYLVKEAGGKSFLDNKVILGCMNRGGLGGTAFEMDDKMTGYTAKGIREMKLDAAKIMFRIETSERESGSTIGYCSDVVNELNDLGIPVFIEALPVKKEGGKYKTMRSVEPLVQVVGVGSGLGYSSLNTWLKIPYCENFDRVAIATTCPILLLGGEATGDPIDILKQFVEGMKAGKNVRGALVGRNITFPGRDDPLAIASAVSGIVHKGFTVEEAASHITRTRGKNIDLLSKLFHPQKVRHDADSRQRESPLNG
jgi:DhnA family fructose-bisphosphate aldolase class Ia